MMQDKYNMKAYWSERFSLLGNKDEEGLAALQTIGAPLWYNRFFVHTESLVLTSLIKLTSPTGKKILDVGCGTGRWTRFYAQKGLALGIDISLVTLKRARKLTPHDMCGFLKMSADNLAFEDESFDIVSSVKVLQHMPYENQRCAIAEMCRVTKKGGFLIVLEQLGTRYSSHVFPNNLSGWIKNFEDYGCSIYKTAGVQYVPLLRLFNKIVSIIARVKSVTSSKKVTNSGLKQAVSFQGTNPKSLLHFIRFSMLRILVYFSYPLEHLCVKTLSPERATHCCLLFRKI